MKDDVENIDFFTKNLKGKVNAVVNKDDNKLSEIIDEEVVKIKSLDFK